MRRALAGALLGVLAYGPAAAADDERVVTITDERIAESSGLAVSSTHPRLLYTVNDSGNEPAVYAIDRRSGDVVGTTTLVGHPLGDIEALALGPDGTLWVADIGDNEAEREDVALYTIDEPGRGDATVTPTRYPVRYPSGPQDAETVLVDPGSRAVYIVSKGVVGGTVYRLPTPLRADHPNPVRPVRRASVPGLVTDGSFTPDGARVVLRTYANAVAYEADGWEETWTTSLPDQQQGESLSVESDGESVLVGSEGLPSPVLRVGLPAPEEPDEPRTSRAERPDAEDASRLDTGIKVLAGLVALLVGLVGWAVVSTRRGRRRGTS